MNRYVLAAALAATCLAPALAADVAPRPLVRPAPAAIPLGWDGFYFGGHAGYGWDLNGVTLDANTPLATVSAQLAAAPHGAVAGLQVGYDWQLSQSLVFGVRVDAALADISASGGAALPLFGQAFVKNATNYVGTVDGRVGYSGFGGHVLPYVVGGFAFGGAKPNFQVATLQQAAADTSVGWNVGAGIETRFDQRWSAFMEVDYVRLGDKQLSASLPGGVLLVTSSNPLSFGVVKAGVNFRFGR